MLMLGQQALVRVPHTQRTTGSSLHYLLQEPSIQITAKVASLSTYKILCYSFHIEKQQDQRNTHFKTAPPAAAQMVKDLPAVQETQAGSLGREYPLRREWQPTPVFWLNIVPCIVLYSRTLLFFPSIFNSLYLPTPNSQSIPPSRQPQNSCLCLWVCFCFIDKFIWVIFEIPHISGILQYSSFSFYSLHLVW